MNLKRYLKLAVPAAALTLIFSGAFPAYSVYAETDIITPPEQETEAVEIIAEEAPNTADINELTDSYIEAEEPVEEITDISSLTTEDIPDQEYTGYEIVPGITIENGETILEEGIDYTVECYNNLDTGTATMLITGINSYTGTLEKNFDITPVNVSKLTCSGISEQIYTGNELCPDTKIQYGENTLTLGTDYTITYTNNIIPGTATAEIQLIGNYDGTRTVYFPIVLGEIKNLSAKAESTSSITLTWDKNGSDSYKIYRYDSSSDKYVYLGTTSSCSYTDTKRTQATLYKYKVCSTACGKIGQPSICSALTKISAPEIKAQTLNKAVKISWKKNTKATGYVIYRYSWQEGSFKKVKTITSGSITSYTDKNLSNSNEYCYKIRTYVKADGKTYYSDYSNIESSSSASSRLDAAKLSPHHNYTFSNTQGSKTVSSTVKISDSDWQTLKKFANEHFTSSMTREEKVTTALLWINRNVKYAYGNDWSKISSKSYVDAIFNYKLGQCAQYNGAMVAMLSYLGYDATLVQGYRGSYPNNYWQHFWGEVNIDGQAYVMETGNYGKNGEWWYVAATYSEAGGYIKNKKNLG